MLENKTNLGPQSIASFRAFWGRQLQRCLPEEVTQCPWSALQSSSSGLWSCYFWKVWKYTSDFAGTIWKSCLSVGGAYLERPAYTTNMYDIHLPCAWSTFICTTCICPCMGVGGQRNSHELFRKNRRMNNFRTVDHDLTATKNILMKNV